MNSVKYSLYFGYALTIGDALRGPKVASMSPINKDLDHPTLQE